LFDNVSVSGLEEEGYRRMAALYRTTREVFPRSHWLLKAFCGVTFFEDILASYFSFLGSREHFCGVSEILEPFDGYIAGPMVRAQAARVRLALLWIRTNVEYEWAIFHARRVAAGWPALYLQSPLPAGAALISADFDLPALNAELKRLDMAAVDANIFLTRIAPSPGSYRAIIYPNHDEVLEARLDDDTYLQLRSTVEDSHMNVGDELKSLLQQIGLTLDCSFLCCSNEKPELSAVSTALPREIAPLPH
jgi:hypothetical protein